MHSPSSLPRNSEPWIPTEWGDPSTPSNHYSASPNENAQTINDIESLKNGIIKTSKNKANAPYNILLLGEASVGKSTFVELIASVLIGKHVNLCDLDVLDPTNDLTDESQTNSAHLYKLTSKNGIVVRILDTPGFADTRHLQQNELRKKSIVTQIKKHFDSLTTVLVLANGTVPRVTVGTAYTLSILSAIFPNVVDNNVAFLLTNVPSPIYLNFPQHTLPAVLKDAPQFLLDNPIALQKRYLKIKDGTNIKTRRTNLRRVVKTGEQSALEMLVNFFDRLDSLEPQSTTNIGPLYKDVTNILVLMKAAVASKAKVSASIPVPSSKQRPASNHDYLCTAPNLYSNRSEQPLPVYSLVTDMEPRLQLAKSSKCIPYSLHCQMPPLPSQQDLSSVKGGNVDKLPQSHPDPLPPGGLSIRIEEVNPSLEDGNTNTEESGAIQNQLEPMRDSPGQKPGILRKAKEAMRQGIQKFKRIFSLPIGK